MVELLGLILTFLVFAIPGIFLSFALFTGTKFNKLDRLFAGLILGIAIVPLLYFIEHVLFGLQLNVFFVFVNSLIVLAAALGIMYFRGLLPFLSPGHVAAVFKHEVQNLEKTPLQFVAPVLLVLIAFFGFYFRIAYSFITNFFEFDPYFYNFLTEMLVTKGAIPLTSDISYFPLVKFYHQPALVQYMTGAWYVVYNFFTNIGYDKGTLILISNIYPPLVGALLSVLAFWLLRAQYNELAGIVGALFFASTPQLLQKLAAGVTELQPWSLFSALLIFTAYMLALRYKTWQFTLLAGLATVLAILGSAQALWPIAIMTSFFIIQSFVNYYANHKEEELAILSVVFSFSVFLATILYNIYADLGVLNFSTVQLVAIISCFPSLLLLFLSKAPHLAAVSRRKIVAGIIVIGFLLSLVPILPGGQSVSSIASHFIEGTAAFAGFANALTHTIAEDTPTSPEILANAFGILVPSLLLVALALLLSISALEVLLLKKQNKFAVIFLLGALSVVFFRDLMSGFLVAFGSSTGLKIVSTFGNLFATNQIFAYMLISIVGAIIAFIYSNEEDRNEASLLTVLIVFPIAYIGLSKVKFILHLGFALAIGAGVLIGELIARRQFIHNYFKLGDSIEMPGKWLTGFAIVLILVLGSVQVFGLSGKAPGVVNSVQYLGSSQISQDWLDAMTWLKNNTSYNNPVLVNNCKVKFGHDCRVVSWWDYGHWTAFLGETKTALDPGNQFEFLDQQVAYGFVDNQTAFRNIMGYHNASHVLVDYQLLDKWGALVYLSGTCQKTGYSRNSTEVIAPNCPDNRGIVDWEKGTGADAYELEHYFERLSANGQCPFSPNMLFMQGSFGSTYCVSQDQFIPLDRDGLRTDLSRGYVGVNLADPKIEEIDLNKHYLIPLSQSSFIDVNPDLRAAGRESKVLNATYTRLYVFENLPGFKLVYRSKNGEVKIFEKITN
ncbi:MAG: hypothetical protein Q8R15_03310 [Candidatus Micrarchaeota archaeon]|nr:hypothetical protein [Candidatus Micrarchaeota archaeon]